MMDAFQQKTSQYYSDKLNIHGPGAEGVGWRNEETQYNRFTQLLKIVNTSDFSINDLGCGTGDLFFFLEKNFSGFQYRGYDVLESMINIAKDRLAHKQNAQCIHITTASGLAIADYTVASGIFNLRYYINDGDWRNYIIGEIDIMNQKSSKGFSFNMLTKYSDADKMEPHLYYGDPSFFFDYCKTNISKNVALLHDYNEYDFTILVRK